MQVTNDVLNALSRSRVEGNLLFLADQLDRSLYLKTNKVLEAAGGVWNRKQKAHIFTMDASERIDQIILSGSIEIPRDVFNFIPSPNGLISEMITRSAPVAGERVLEPEFGDGRILKAIKQSTPGALITGVELNDERFQQVKNNFSLSEGIELVHADFLSYQPDNPFDVIIMNPPFLKRSDIKHVMHAIAMLTKNGRLQAILSAGVLFRKDNLTVALTERVKQLGGNFTPLPVATFKESGVNVNTVRLELDLRG
ncbi:methyltransferase [Salmonella enterica]|nr:methyltransferase [Salmonella enterica subsp. enterica serovar Stanley]